MDWIKVEDKLPKDKTECIGYFKQPYKGEFKVNEVWFVEGRWYWDLDYIDNITHWMPLPKAPKE